MDYFLLKSCVENPIKINIDVADYNNINKKNIFRKLPKLSVTYMEYSEFEEIPEYLQYPFPLAGQQLKQVISMYDEHIQWKGIQVFPDKEELAEIVAPCYWLGNYMVQECIHQNTVFYPNGMLENLVLQRRKIRNLDIFQIGGILENRIVVSLALAESILRRNIYGVGIEEIIMM